MPFNERGNYPAGVHSIEIDEFRNLFVQGFPNSEKRVRNMQGLTDFLNCDYMEKYKPIFTKVWIDGSFCTNKEEPNDIDGVIFMDPHPDTYHLVEEFQNDFQKWHSLGKEYYCDLYPVNDVDLMDSYKPILLNIMNEVDFQNIKGKFDYQFKYWLGQFTFDRERHPKGIFEIVLQGGEFDV